MDLEFEIVADRDFGEERVPADGREFVRCTFNETILVFEGRKQFILGSVTGTFNIDFVGAAENVLMQLASMHRFGMGDMVEAVFAHIRNPLGESVQ